MSKRDKVIVLMHHTAYNGNDLLAVFNEYVDALLYVKKMYPKGHINHNGDWELGETDYFENEWITFDTRDVL